MSAGPMNDIILKRTEDGTMSGESSAWKGRYIMLNIVYIAADSTNPALKNVQLDFNPEHEDGMPAANM
jgi:hypothetical protein